MQCPRCRSKMVKNGFHRGNQRWLCPSCGFLTSKSQRWYESVWFAYDDYLNHYVANKTEVNTGVKRQSIQNWLTKAKREHYKFADYEKEINPFIQLGWVKWKASNFEEYMTSYSKRFIVRPFRDRIKLTLISESEQFTQPLIEVADFHTRKSSLRVYGNIIVDRGFSDAIMRMSLPEDELIKDLLLDSSDLKIETLPINRIGKLLFSEVLIDRVLAQF